MTEFKFEAGKVYKMTFVTDSDLVVPVTIVKRTAKFVTIELNEKTKRCGVKTYNGSEYILPDGSYSMAPSCYAEKLFISENKCKSPEQLRSEMRRVS